MNTLMTLIMIFLNVIKTTGDCPRPCECKWKNGKESVFCENANMTEIPKQLDSGTQVLALTGNRFQKIGADEFFNARLLNLQKIFLSRCHLRSIDPSAFRRIINLVELDLSYNDLHSVPSHTFAFIKELRELRLNGNPIVRLLNYAFQMVPHLTKLELSECRIAYVETKAFQGLENSLEWLKLDKNKITNIKSQALVNLVNLHGLELSGNSWNCSCGLRTLREWMMRQNVPYNIPPLCKHPPRLYGKIWDKLELDEFACLPKIEPVSPWKSGEEGNNITMSCSVNGIPEPNIRWFRKNQVIANFSGIMSGPRKKLYVVQITKQISSLTILAADAQDNGIYVCRAENKAGKAEANITLSVAMKPVVKIWSGRMIIAVGVVSLLFATAVGLLTYCAWSLKKRKFYNQHSVNRRELMDDYEMKHKNPNGYNKITNYGNHLPANTTESLQRVTGFKNTRIDEETAKITNNGRSESINLLSKQKFGNADKMRLNFSKASETEEKLKESNYSRLSPDLHIPEFGRQTNYQNSPGLKNSENSQLFEQSLRSSSFRSDTQDMNLKASRENSFFLSNAFSKNQEIFPDLLELSRNEENLINNNPFSTVPKKKSYSMKRTRHGSFGSESQSPLLPESSGDSCDSNYSFSGRIFFNKNSSLPASPCSFSQTPILNILDGSSNIFTGSSTTLKYKSWELEKFLKEYRSLQDQLYKMKESCENLKEDNLEFRGAKDSSNTVESATISKMISPGFLENSYKSGFLNEADNVRCLYNGNEFLEKDNNNTELIIKNKSKLKPVLSNSDLYWSSGNQFLETLPNSGNSFYKS